MDLWSLVQVGERSRCENTPPVKLLDLEDNIREYLHNLGTGEFFLSHKKSIIHKGKDKFVYITTEHFFLSDDPTESEKGDYRIHCQSP